MNAHTIADGLRVPAAVGDFLMLRDLAKAAAPPSPVTDAAMVDGMRRLGRSKASARRPRAAPRWLRSIGSSPHGTIGRDDLVVLFNTGGALKYLDVLTTPSTG